MDTKISVRSDLLKIAEDLKVIAETAAATSESLGEATKEVGKSVNDQISVVSGGMDKLRKFGQNLVQQLGSDFKGLLSVNALASGLKLNEQFAGSIKEAVNLNDTIRNLAPIFGMGEASAEKFKRSLVKGLSDIGVGADAAANALTGLAETNVRGETNLAAYAKTASELAGISKQKGQEGTIAKGLSNVVVAQGGNPNDPKAMQKVAEDIVRIRNATGKSATEALATLDKLFSSVNTDFKKKLMQGGGVSLAAAGLMGGHGSTDFLQRFMGMSKQARAGMEAQGLGKLVGENGQVNTKAFENTVGEAKRRGGGNAEFGLETMGMGEEEAKGFLRLAAALKENGAAIERDRTAVVDINHEYRDTMSLGDSFRANINKVKGNVTGLMDKIGAPDVINKGTKMLGKASESSSGSAAIVGGGALLAAVLTSRGLGGIGGMLGGEMKAKATEAVTGEKVQKVEVINFPIGFGAGGAASVAGSGAMATIGKGGLIAGAAVGGIVAGKYASDKFSEATKGTAVDKTLNDFVLKMGQLVGLIPTAVGGIQHTKDVRVIVDSKNKDLKAFPQGSRGAHQ